MKEPFQSTNIALSLIRGLDVEDWVEIQLQNLEQEALLKGYESEDIWDEFEDEFLKAFTDTTKQAQAYQRLMNFTQGTLTIDEYIAKFKTLCKRAKWGRSTQGAIQLFWDGLRSAIHNKIMDREVWPATMDQWQVMA